MLLLLLHHTLQSCSVVLLIDNKFAGVNGRPVHFCTEIERSTTVEVCAKDTISKWHTSFGALGPLRCPAVIR